MYGTEQSSSTRKHDNCTSGVGNEPWFDPCNLLGPCRCQSIQGAAPTRSHDHCQPAITANLVKLFDERPSEMVGRSGAQNPAAQCGCNLGSAKCTPRASTR